MKTIVTTHSITNTSDKWLLVGNSHEVIAAYDTKQEAVEDLDNQVPCIEESPWGDVQIVAPAETRTGKYTTIRPLSPQEKKAQQEEFDKEFDKLFGSGE
jgi:hypothetical protein